MDVSDLTVQHQGNLARVDSLIEAYQAVQRPPATGDDLLRAAVVFTHAVIESLVRSLLSVRLPSSSPEVLSNLLSFPTNRFGIRAEKVGWELLLARRTSTVDELLDEAVQHFLSRFNLNHPSDLHTALRHVGLASTGKRVLELHGTTLDALMKRRHWIVHQLDLSAAGTPYFLPQPIEMSTVSRFRDTACVVGEIILQGASTEIEP